MPTNVAVIRFPGTNCEFDVVEVVQQLGAQAQIVFHDEPNLGAADAVVIAGGFAHGDYLRPGAIARFSPVMEAVASFAKSVGQGKTRYVCKMPTSSSVRRQDSNIYLHWARPGSA
jgi:phosphoribosylformylglycinamidine synthase